MAAGLPPAPYDIGRCAWVTRVIPLPCSFPRLPAPPPLTKNLLFLRSHYVAAMSPSRAVFSPLKTDRLPRRFASSCNIPTEANPAVARLFLVALFAAPNSQTPGQQASAHETHDKFPHSFFPVCPRGFPDPDGDSPLCATKRRSVPRGFGSILVPLSMPRTAAPDPGRPTSSHPESLPAS